MRNPRKQFLILLAVFLLSMMILNRFIGSAFKSHNARETKKKPEFKQPEVFDESKSKYHPKEDDPAKYGVAVQGQYDIPLTEKQWEYKMRQGLSSSSTADPALVESLQGVEKSPQEINERLTDLNAQIKEYEATTLNNPNDRKAQERLQTLYMLKATLVVLRDQVTSHP